jgi:hypothetical protein
MKPIDITEMPIIRRTTPISLAYEIQSTIPMNTDNNDVKYKTTQEILVFDPRTYIDVDININNKVQVQRVIVEEPISGNENRIYIRYQTIIEIIKEYSFDDWDKELKNYIKGNKNER